MSARETTSAGQAVSSIKLGLRIFFLICVLVPVIGMVYPWVGASLVRKACERKFPPEQLAMLVARFPRGTFDGFQSAALRACRGEFYALRDWVMPREGERLPTVAAGRCLLVRYPWVVIGMDGVRRDSWDPALFIEHMSLAKLQARSMDEVEYIIFFSVIESTRLVEGTTDTGSTAMIREMHQCVLVTVVDKNRSGSPAWRGFYVVSGSPDKPVISDFSRAMSRNRLVGEIVAWLRVK